jgi:hypothetical protein
LKLKLNKKIPLESEKNQKITIVTIAAQMLDLLQSFRKQTVILNKNFIFLSLTYR